MLLPWLRNACATKQIITMRCFLHMPNSWTERDFKINNAHQNIRDVSIAIAPCAFLIYAWNERQILFFLFFFFFFDRIVHRSLKYGDLVIITKYIQNKVLTLTQISPF